MSRVIGRKLGNASRATTGSTSTDTVTKLTIKQQVPTDQFNTSNINSSQLTLTPSKSDLTLPLDSSAHFQTTPTKQTRTEAYDSLPTITKTMMTPSSSNSSLNSAILPRNSEDPYSKNNDQDGFSMRQLELASPFLISTRSPIGNGKRSRSGSDLPLTHPVINEDISLKINRTASPMADWDLRKEDLLENTFNVNESSGEDEDDTVLTSQEINQGQDIGSPQVNTTESSLSCPICEEEMITLNQLNRHIDDIHLNPNINVFTKETLHMATNSSLKKSNSGLFSASQLSADQSFDALSSLINKKTNEYKAKFQDINLPKQLQSTLDSLLQDNGLPSTKQLVFNEASTGTARKKHSIEITRRHWQKQKKNQRCSFNPRCQYTNILNLKTGIIHCRHCGKIYCREHTRYHTRLTEDAEYFDPNKDSTKNIPSDWACVCYHCYSNRPWFNEFGETRDLTGSFSRLRTAKFEKLEIERIKLQKRLITLINGITKIMSSENSTLFSKITSTINLNNSSRIKLEKSLIPWQDESTITNCPLCLQTFGYILRKHHCRGCGMVVCSDNLTNCSKSFDIKDLKKMASEDTLNARDYNVSDLGYSVLLCKSCTTSLINHNGKTTDLNNEVGKVSDQDSLIFSKLHVLLSLKQTIKFYCSKLTQLIDTISANNLATTNQLSQLELLRTRLTSALKQYSSQTKELFTNFNPTTADQQALLHSIKQVSTHSIQEATMIIKSLPKLLKQISTDTPLSELSPGISSSTSTPEPQTSSSTPTPQFIQSTSTQPILSIADAHKIKELRQTLLILNEQSFLIKAQIQNAIQSRKFDDLKILKTNIQDLENEMNITREKLINLGDVNEGL